MSLEVASLHGRVTVDIRDADKKLKQVRTDVNRTDQSFQRAGKGVSGSFTPALMGAVSAFGAMELGRRAVQLADLGVRAQKTGQAFEALSGGPQQAAANMDAMRRASDGLLSTMEAQQQANRLLSLGIVQTSKEMEAFTRDAITLGAAMSMDAATSIDNLSAAIANMSFVRLDQMGLSAGQARQRVQELQDATAGLSKEAAFAQAVMEQMARKSQALRDAGFQAASGFDKLRSALADVAAEGGKNLGFIDRFAGAIGDSLSNTIETNRALNEQRDAVNAAKAALKDYAFSLQGDEREAFAHDLGRINAMLDAGNWQGAIAELDGYEEAQTSVRDAVQETIPEVRTASMTANEFSGELSRLRGMAMEAAGGVNALSNEVAVFNELASRMAGVDLSGLSPEQARKVFEEQTARRQREVGGVDFGLMRHTSEGKRELRQVASEAANERVKAEIAAEERAAKEAVKIAGQKENARVQLARDAFSRIERIASDAESNVQGAISGALDLSGGGVTQNQMLMARAGIYQDQVGEFSRQLQDVINRGADSPLLSQIPELQQFAGNNDMLRGQAALMQQRFQAGLMPGKINREALKRRVREQLIGQRNLREIQKEVFDELKAEGVVATEFESLVSDQFGTGFKAGLKATPFGQDLSSQILMEVRNNQEQLSSAGKETFSALFKGFQEEASQSSFIEEMINLAVKTTLRELAAAGG